MRISSDPLPTQWQVRLNDGSVLGVWAGVYGKERDHYIFSVVADASEAERRDPNVRLTGNVPDQRIMFAVARIPITLVAEIRQTTWDEPPGRNPGFLRS